MEALGDHPAKLRAELEPRPSRPPRAPPGLAVCGVGAVAPPPAATVDLTRDRRVRAAQRPGDRARRVPAGDRAEISSRSSRLKHLWGAGAPSAGCLPFAPGGCSRSPRKAEPPPDLAIAQPLRSQLPDPVLRRLAQAVAPWHHRTSLVGQRVADSLGWCGGGLRPPMRATAIPREPLLLSSTAGAAMLYRSGSTGRLARYRLLRRANSQRCDHRRDRRRHTSSSPRTPSGLGTLHARGFEGVDAGEAGDLRPPPGELAVHPGSGWGRGLGSRLFLMAMPSSTPSRNSSARASRSISDRGRGLGPDRALQVPGAGEIGLYDPGTQAHSKSSRRPEPRGLSSATRPEWTNCDRGPSLGRPSRGATNSTGSASKSRARGSCSRCKAVAPCQAGKEFANFAHVALALPPISVPVEDVARWPLLLFVHCSSGPEDVRAAASASTQQ